MYVHIRTYTCDVYVQFSEKNMCMCGFVYVQFGSTFQMCMFGIFRSNSGFMSRNASEIEGNCNKR